MNLQDNFNQLVKKQLSGHIILHYNSSDINFSKQDILIFLENNFLQNIREFDSLLEKCYEEIKPMKTNIVLVESEISQERMNEIQSKKEVLENDISDLIKMSLSLENLILNSAVYLLINKTNLIKNRIHKFNIDYFNYTGGISEEISYLKKVIQQK